MSEILWLIILSICLGYIIDRRNESLAFYKTGKKERIITFSLIIVLSLFCGLRTWYNDTVTYYQIYEQTPVITEFWSSSDAKISSGLGFGFLNSVMKTIGFSAQDFLMFYAFASIIPCVLFIRKYSGSVAFSVFLLFATGYYVFTLAAVKQCVATGICLIAIDAALERKWLKFYLLIILAALFHPYAIVYIIVPFMMFKPWTSRTWIYVIVFVVIGFLLENLLGIVLDITDMIGADYTEVSFTGSGVNKFRVLVALVPMVIAIMYNGLIFENKDEVEYLMFNLAMINGLIMFVGMFGTANYFARLANYFLPAQMVVIPWIIKAINFKDKRWIAPLCIIGYSVYFYYENVILRPFDSYFDCMSFWDYICSLF